MRTCLSVVLPIIWFAAEGSPVWGQAAIESPAIMAARKRQEALQTIEFTFSRTDVDMPAVLGPPGPPGAKKSKKPIPEKETIVESKDNRILFDGMKGRLEDHHPIWNEQTGLLSTWSKTGTTQGSAAKVHITRPRQTDGNYSVGSIERTGSLAGLLHDILLPFALFCRPLDPQFCPSPLSDFAATGRQESMNGVACEVFRSKEGGQQYREVWLDPKRDYLPVRYRHLIQGKVRMNAEVEYQPHPEVGWVLKGWKVTQYGHGAVPSLLRTSTIQIDSVQIQSKYSDDLFDIVFPPETVVYDDRDKKTYQVQSNGDLREQLGNGTLTGSSIAQRGWWDRYRWALVAGGIGLLLGGGVWVVRRRRRTPT